MGGCAAVPGAGVRLGKAVVSRHCPVLHQLLPASPPKYLLPSTCHPSPAVPTPPGALCGVTGCCTRRGPLQPQAGWLATCRHCPSAADPAGTPSPSSPVTAWRHPAVVDAMMLGDHRAACWWLPDPQVWEGCPARMGPTRQATESTRWEQATCCPQGGALGTSPWGQSRAGAAGGLCSPGCRPSGPSPPRPPTPGKRSGVR